MGWKIKVFGHVEFLWRIVFIVALYVTYRFFPAKKKIIHSVPSCAGLRRILSALDYTTVEPKQGGKVGEIVSGISRCGGNKHTRDVTSDP